MAADTFAGNPSAQPASGSSVSLGLGKGGEEHTPRPQMNSTMPVCVIEHCAEVPARTRRKRPVSTFKASVPLHSHLHIWAGLKKAHRPRTSNTKSLLAEHKSHNVRGREPDWALTRAGNFYRLTQPGHEFALAWSYWRRSSR